uniref:WEB family protein n=1 Tax=Cannabis sativa TaxID=3483 RepID=A0A803QF21_CANSA
MTETLDSGSRGVLGEIVEMNSNVMELDQSNVLNDSGSKMRFDRKNSSETDKGLRKRAEIDTSAPFESVKEAYEVVEELDITKLEEQALHLEKDLIIKERETLDVLKDLEKTRMNMEELKQKLQKEAAEVNLALQANAADKNVNEADKENRGDEGNFCAPVESINTTCPSSAPGLILMELKQAKLNLTRTTTDLADIRYSVDVFNKKLEKERLSLEKTRERLTQNSSKILSLEEELNQTKVKLQLVKDAESRCVSDSPSDISKELQRLSFEVDQFKQMGEAARSEVLRATQEIEQTKTKIKTAEIRLIAARKMKEAARAAEAVALAEIKAMSYPDGLSGDGDFSQNQGITLTYEEYSSLICKAREAEELSKKRVVDAMDQVDDANISKMDILKKVEEATEEVRTSQKTLEEALSRVEAANRGKLAVEEALRRWRSEHGQRRRSSVHNSTKFKNSHPSHHRRDSRLLDVNGLHMVTDGSKPVLKPTLSIGQILSRKLLLPEELEMGLSGKGSGKPKVSLGQMLGKQNGDIPSSLRPEKENCNKQFSCLWPLTTSLKGLGHVPSSLTVCNSHAPTINHALLTCDFVKACWAIFGLPINMVASITFGSWFEILQGTAVNDQVLVSTSIIHDYWRKALDKVALLSLSFDNSGDRAELWTKLASNHIKINVDAELFHQETSYDFGIVVRDNLGKLIEAKTTHHGGIYSAEVVEALGIKKALS